MSRLWDKPKRGEIALNIIGFGSGKGEGEGLIGVSQFEYFIHIISNMHSRSKKQ